MKQIKLKNLFDALINRYQNNSQSIRGSEFVFDYVQFFFINAIKKISIVVHNI